MIATPIPCPGEALDDPVLVGAEDEVRLEAGGADLVDDELGRAAAAVADQRLLGDLAEGRRSPLGAGTGSRRR